MTKRKELFGLKSHIWKIMIPQHLLLLIGLILLFLGYGSFWSLLLIPLGYLILGYCGASLFIHRYWCHRSFETHPLIAYIGAYFGLLCGSGTPITVEAIHMRMHHSHSDTENDPHSPIYGVFWSWIGWHNMTIKWPKLNRNLVSNPVLRFMHRNYFKIWWTTVIIALIINWQFAIFFIIGAGVYNFHLEGLVNSFCHMHDEKYGYRNGNTSDNSTNLNSKLLMFLSFGNSLHHNHHLQPRNYTYALKPGEFDLAKYIVPLIQTKKEI